MRLSIATTFAALLACAQFREVVTSPSGRSAAFVYLHPAKQGSGQASEVSPKQIHRILTNHLSVPKAEDEGDIGEKISLEAWDWLETPPVLYKGKEVQLSAAAQEDTSGKKKQRTFILLSGVDESELKDVMPTSLRNTHVVVDAPHPSSFEALADSYGQQIYGAGVAGAASAFAGFFVAAAEGMEHALEGAAEWLTGHGASALSAGMRVIDQTNAVDQASRAFYESLRNFVTYMDTLDKPSSSSLDHTDASPYQSLRLDGLNEIKSTYGQESDEYKRAKQSLGDLLNAAVDKLESLHQSKAHSVALIALPSTDGVTYEDTSVLQKRNRLLSPFRGTVIVTPFLASRSLDEESKSDSQALQRRQMSGSVAKSKPTKKPTLPKDSDLANQCFKSESDLNKASQNCTGHGSAVQTSRGGRKCYRCKCQRSKAKGGKLIDWTGQACQRQSIAKPFALLAATTLLLLIVSYASVYFLFYEGSKELPSVLAGISIPSKSR